MTAGRYFALGLAVLMAGCASTHRTTTAIAVAVQPPEVALQAPTLPPGATPGMLVPYRLADGSYPTPNRALSSAASLWHLRAGLNVAALSCRGAGGDGIVAGYNAWLTQQKAVLARAQTTYAAEYKTQGGRDWQDRYDDAMTRLYNFFSQTPARPAFCAAATRAIAALGSADAATLPTVAVAQLKELDAPFTDFYRAYDAWRSGGTVVIASAAAPAPHPRLDVDLSKLPQ